MPDETSLSSHQDPTATAIARRPSGSAREALRSATGAAHLRLHAIPAFHALAEGRLPRDDYAALLQRSLGFHAALEARLAEAPRLSAYGIDLEARRRTPLLRADLAWLGVPDRVGMAELAPFPNAEAALGGLYVAEGSTLGGRLLSRGLDGILPPGLEGRRFLLGHGERHARMWRDCCAAIERGGATEAGRSAMIGGAIATFCAFEAWFSAADRPESGARAGRGQPVASFSSSPLPP